MPPIRNPLKCSKCTRTFANRSGLSSHLRLVHKIVGMSVAAPKSKNAKPSYFHPTIKCPECPAVFKRKTGLGSHLRSVHGIIGQSKTALEFRRKKEHQGSPATPVQEMLPTLESSAPNEEQVVPAHSVDLRSPLPSQTKQVTCPECGEPFARAAELGRHRRFKHGILGKAAQRELEAVQVAEAPKRKGRPPGTKNKEQQSTQIQISERAISNEQKLERSHETHAILNPLAYALTIGSIKEFCRHAAEEHGVPTREFTRQCAELFLREARR